MRLNTMCNYNKDIFDSLYEQTKGFNEFKLAL